MGEGWSQSFQLNVCSPRWLDEHFGTSDLPGFAAGDPRVLFGHDFLLMRSWDYSALLRAITDVCDALEGPTWEALAEQLDRYLPWEFHGA